MSLNSPSGGCDLLNVSSPELELISPFSPNVEESAPSEDVANQTVSLILNESVLIRITKLIQITVASLLEQDLDRKSDTVSETGTYTLEGDNYSEEQKARMSIDNEFKLEKLTVEEKTVEYIRSLSVGKYLSEDSFSTSQISGSSSTISSLQSSFSANGLPPVPPLKSHPDNELHNKFEMPLKKLLSPILSPTQNVSIVDQPSPVHSPKLKLVQQRSDEGAVISVTSSGAFRSKSEEKARLERRLSLTKSEVHVEAYIDGKIYNEEMLNNCSVRPSSNRKSKLTANIVNVQSIEVNPTDVGSVVSASFSFGKTGNIATGKFLSANFECD